MIFNTRPSIVSLFFQMIKRTESVSFRLSFWIKFHLRFQNSTQDYTFRDECPSQKCFEDQNVGFDDYVHQPHRDFLDYRMRYSQAETTD